MNSRLGYVKRVFKNHKTMPAILKSDLPSAAEEGVGTLVLIARGNLLALFYSMILLLVQHSKKIYTTNVIELLNERYIRKTALT